MIWQTILDFSEDHLGRPLSQIYVKKPRRSNFGCQFKTWSARLFWEDWKQACQSRIWTGSLVFKLPEWSASRVGVQFLNWQLGFRSDTKLREFAIACRFPIESKVTENVLRLDHDVQDVMQLQVPLPGTRTLGAVKHPLVSREKAGPSPTLPQERAQLRYHVNPVAQNNQYG